MVQIQVLGGEGFWACGAGVCGRSPLRETLAASHDALLAGVQRELRERHVRAGSTANNG